MEPRPPHNYGPRTRDTALDPPLAAIYDVIKFSFQRLMSSPFADDTPFKRQIPKNEQWRHESEWYWAVRAFPDFPAKVSPYAACFFKVRAAFKDAFGGTMLYDVPLSTFSENKAWAKHVAVDMKTWFQDYPHYIYEGSVYSYGQPPNSTMQMTMLRLVGKTTLNMVGLQRPSIFAHIDRAGDARLDFEEFATMLPQRIHVCDH